MAVSKMGNCNFDHISVGRMFWKLFKLNMHIASA